MSLGHWILIVVSFFKVTSIQVVGWNKSLGEVITTLVLFILFSWKSDTFWYVLLMEIYLRIPNSWLKKEKRQGLRSINTA